MDRQDKEIHVQAEDASGGTKHHGVRYVLAVSLVLVIVAFVVIYMFRSGHS